ncbi:MAG: ACT domain-containing protein [Dehalococcoidia bacterium]|nr:ACT domain-containing protein [Dehalococcoidia bacterium]
MYGVSVEEGGGAGHEARRCVLSKDRFPETTGGDKTTILFDLENQPGALVKVLSLFSSRGLNATMLQSRPSRLDPGAGLWEYTFIAEYLGHIRDQGLAEAYAEVEAGLGTLCKRIRLLGSYPRSSMGEND